METPNLGQFVYISGDDEFGVIVDIKVVDTRERIDNFWLQPGTNIKVLWDNKLYSGESFYCWHEYSRAFNVFDDEQKKLYFRLKEGF